jgi:hypothetical protein
VEHRELLVQSSSVTVKTFTCDKQKSCNWWEAQIVQYSRLWRIIGEIIALSKVELFSLIAMEKYNKRLRVIIWQLMLSVKVKFGNPLWY